MAREPQDLERAAGRARRAGRRLQLPSFETDPDRLGGALEEALAEAGRQLDGLVSRKRGSLDFDSSLGALDRVGHDTGQVAARIHLLQEASPDPALRDRARDLIKRYQDWAVSLEYREDVYRAIGAYAESGPALEGERKRLLEHVLRSYRRAGLGLPPGERGKVEALRKQLAAAGTDFDANITRATAVVEYAAEELEGVPEAFLAQESLRDGEGRYRVRAEIAWHYLAVMENARREDSRRRMEEARHGLAAGSNIGILGRMLRLRREIAGRLGYASWADYRTEVRMAGRGEAAAGFLKELSSGLEGKFRQELEGWRRMKAADSGDPGAAVRSWDWRYYARREVRERLDVDKEALRAWFPYEAVRDGLFSLAEQLFSLEAAPLAGAPSWAEGVEAWLVSDAGGPPLGVLYLDMFPREGKFRHFAQFGLIGGRRLSGGGYQCPCAALVCNFPPPSSGRPSLLSHDEVLTLFHEFGHALHSLLARSEFSEFSGTSVPRDFVEVPSQLMERWAWDQETLEGFAAHWREPGRPMEPGTIERLHRARLASVGTHYRRQAAFGLLDLAFHGPEAPADPLALSREILSRIFLPPPPGGAFVAGFGHLNGYDAGYYGYAWSDAIVADLDTVFGGSSRARRDPALGRRLREEILEVGDSRDPVQSVERFLGRPRSLAPFLESLGIGSPSSS